MPNVFGRDARDSHYDSADAALWFALAVQRWQDAGVDAAEVRDRFGAALRSIAESYLDGTELGLRTDEEGLLCAGSKDRNATWMDARIGEQPVTPRNGQPVEIVGLWCALLEHLGELFGKPWRKLARTTGKAFVERGDQQSCRLSRRWGRLSLGPPQHASRSGPAPESPDPQAEAGCCRGRARIGDAARTANLGSE